MFGLDKFFKGNEKQDKPEGPDPLKIRELLEEHPAFTVLTVDGLKWIDPHTLTCVDCPFGYVDTALDWLMQNQPWKEHKLRHPKEVRMKRWWMHIQENLDLDPRWKLFSAQGVWLNPFNAQLEERAVIQDGKISRETITMMARSLVDYEEKDLNEMLKADVLQKALEDESQKPQTEAIIKSTERFEVHNKNEATIPSQANEQLPAAEIHDPDATIATDFNLPGETYDPDATIATDFEIHSQMEESDPTLELPSTVATDIDKTMDVDFSQGSLLEEPHPNKPIRSKETESFRRAKTDPEIGDQVAGYKIVSFLGKGGMGNVHKAVQMSMQREVALKILPPELCRDDTFSTRFIREARAAGKVNHPNVITCFDVGNDKGVLYMALELVTGGDVSEMRKKNGGKLPLKKALRIITDCTRGLAAIHKAGLIHRDIKPANIFMSEDGIAKLADLGLARSSANNTQMTQAGTSVGTPAYMSPEQVKGLDTIDIRTDIYALGVTFYTILCGENPFKANDVWALFRMIVQDEVPNICELVPDLPSTFNDFIQKCLAKEPDDRFANPLEMLEALDELS